MIKEQEEAINRLRKITNRQILYGNKCGIVIEEFKKLQEDIETVLNMLKENSAEIQQKNIELAEKNAEIEKYKKLLADNLAKKLNDSIKAKEKADTDLDDLDKGWKVELEKKDKMIDLLLDFIYKMSIIRPGTIMYDLKGDGFDTNKCGYCKDKSCKDCIKQYFERKLEYGR